MSLKSQLYKSIRSMPSCIAGGYIDLEHDKLIAMLAVEPYPKEKLDRLVGVADDLFQGPNVVMIEDIFNKSQERKDKDLHLFQEIVVTTDDFMHIHIRGTANSNHIISFVSSKSHTLVMSLAKARTEALKLEAAMRAEKGHKWP